MLEEYNQVGHEQLSVWKKYGLNLRTGGRFSKDPETDRARKAILETMIHLQRKAALLICFRCQETQNNCQVSKLERCSYRKYKGICHLKSFGTFEKRAPGRSRQSVLTNGERPWLLLVFNCSFTRCQATIIT